MRQIRGTTEAKDGKMSVKRPISPLPQDSSPHRHRHLPKTSSDQSFPKALFALPQFFDDGA